MQKEEFILIATKITEATATETEKELFLYHVNTYIAQNPAWAELGNQVQQSIKQELKLAIDKDINHHALIKPKTSKLWLKISAAAAVISITFGIWTYTRVAEHSKLSNDLSLAQDLPPGKNGATLTLANGKNIKLADADQGELAEEAGVLITKTSEGELVYQIANSTAKSNMPDATNTLTTANGETYQVKLPDGSLVYLNAGSSLTYNTSIIQAGKRTVGLTGEGYFQVAKDKAHPFIVKTRHQEVVVLGTHFNISSYEDEPAIKTTLLEGAVNIKSNDTEIRLKPGEQAIQTSKGIKVAIADEEEVMAWRNGKIVFHNEPLGNIMKKVARWYNVEVIYEPGIENIAFIGSVSRKTNISAVLQYFERTENIKFTIKDRKVTVSAKTK